MQAARKRTVLFLICAAVLLAAGYGWGYSTAHDRFYAPEALLDTQLESMDFNNRLMHYANLNQSAECRRELLTRLQEQITYVQSVAPDCQDLSSRREAEKSVENARLVMAGQPLVAGASNAPPARH